MSKLTIEQVKTIGTKIPISGKFVRRCTEKDYDFNDFGEGCTFIQEKIVNRTLIVNGEDCVAVDYPNYKGNNSWVVPISELIRIGIVEPEFVLPERWYIKITEENKEIVSNWIGHHTYILGNHSSVHFDKKACDIVNLHPDYEEITFEQFLKHVLKQKEMKITGYKILKPVPLTTFKVGSIIGKDSGYFDDCINYPEFFEPIYEEEYKVDDYVIVISNECTNKKSTNRSRYTIGLIGKIKKVGDEFYKNPKTKWLILEGFNDGITCNQVRKATPEEIEKYNTIEINGYKADYSKEGHVQFGCKSFNKQSINNFKYLLDKVDNAKITIGSTEITTTILNKILEKLNN